VEQELRVGLANAEKGVRITKPEINKKNAINLQLFRDILSLVP
jgi:hypothetical protein